ncbi:MAG: gliding motility-associated C-terminal domain-containing protein [Bacteroidales bacterium]|nr:gliding motility-associated C-terminal domain-containing protein [Bacteroidales bacterium]
MKLKFYILILLPILFFITTKAMDIRSLYLGYERVGQLAYEAKVVAYTFNSGPVDSTITVAWGDNDTTEISLQNTTVVNNYLRKLEYSGKHTYSGVSKYTISVEYYNRGANVNNINNSSNETIFVEADIIINPFLGSNSSPEFTMPPIDNACLNQSYIFEPGIIDKENDSIVIVPVACKGKDGNIISSYTYPQASNSYDIDPSTGTIFWDSPVNNGRYNIAFRINEYRNGVLIGSSMRDMQINVGSCNNNAPDLFTFPDTCIEVGGLMNAPAYTIDNTGDTLSISAFGEIMNLPQNPGQFASPALGVDSAGDYFTWSPGCDLVRKAPYQITFLAKKRNAIANGYYPYTNDFNSGFLGSGWDATSQLTFTNPCPPSADGTTYLWMGNDQAHPRRVTTQAFDMTGGANEIHFDMKWSTQGMQSPCEGPDLPDEGIHFQYSTNGINGPWKEIIYWDPSKPPPGGINPMLTVWNHYSLPIPQAAITTNTRFRFLQTASSGAHYDHWGIDNFQIFDRPENLSRTRTVDVLVIAPAPENLTATAINQTIELNWNKSKCPNATGYKIYRKNSYIGYTPSNCQTGVPAYTGYKKIATLGSIDDTTFTDDNNGQGLPQGFSHCYMVTAIFPDGAESYPSLEACATIDRDKPLLTKVSVVSTDQSGGEMNIEWSKPPHIDNAYNGPFHYLIYRSEDTTQNWTLIDSTLNVNDTSYSDINLNTLEKQYHYRIDFFQVAPSQRIKISESAASSSVYLLLSSGDEKITLTLNYDVSWNNQSAVVYRQDPGSATFDSVTTITTNTYIDTGLVNAKTYCYKVKTKGSYSANGIVDPILNLSQVNCAQPKDNEAPCAPHLVVTVNCLDVSNNLLWNNPNNSCASDVASYDIYYRPLVQGNFTFLHANNSPEDTTYTHQKTNSIAGCYQIVAVDSSGNESDPSNVVCVDIDSCDIYRLPNVFTPNGDGINDYFKPFPYDFVEHVDMKIFNRWGNLVYETNDPDINWDGRHQNNGEKCAAGVYYYVCEVYQRTLEGQEKITLTGNVHLLR